MDTLFGTLSEFIAFNNFTMEFFPLFYYEVGHNEVDCKEPVEIKISPVKDLIGILFVRNLVHCVHVMNPGLHDMEEGRYLDNYIIEAMDLDATFDHKKTRPPEKIKTQINSG